MSKKIPPPTIGIKLGTQPAGAILDPGDLKPGDIRYFRRAGEYREHLSHGRLYKRRVEKGICVKVDRIVRGVVCVSHYP